MGITQMDMLAGHSLFERRADLLAYQVVFAPCGPGDDPIAASPTAIANIHAFVEAGGKLYVTDWSYEFARQPFPGRLTWEGETTELGSAIEGSWAGAATVVDKGLQAWLTATGEPSFEIFGNWTSLTAVHTTTGKDEHGNEVQVTPKVWVTADKDGTEVPATVSFEEGCGRVLFSTYHAESAYGGTGPLLTQEKALLHVLLEVSVCAGKRPGVN